MSITATELELLACFGVEPVGSGEDVPWQYDGSIYSVHVGEYQIVFSVQPACRDIGLSIRLGDHPLYDLRASNVCDLRIIDKHGIDALEVVLTDRDSLFVQLRPSVIVSQTFHTS